MSDSQKELKRALERSRADLVAIEAACNKNANATHRAIHRIDRCLASFRK